MNKVSIKGLDKAEVLAALYNRAQTGGTGFLQYDPTPMTLEEARELLQKTSSFDYLKGRSMKVNLRSDEEFDATQYDHPAYNGPGAAEEAIQALRETGDVNPPSTQVAHRDGTISAAEKTKAQFGEKSRWVSRHVLRTGIGDLADELGPKVDEAAKYHLHP